MQNNPPPNYPPPNAPQGQPYGQPPSPKKSKAPWIIAGVLGCLGIVVVVILALGGLAYLGFKKADETAKSLNSNRDTNHGMNRNANRSSAPTSSSSGTQHYANTHAGRTGNLDKYYVDFSFDYPSAWKLDPDPDPSYVRVERMAGDVTTENFSVGWFGATGNSKGNTAPMSKLVNQLAEQVSGNFPGFEKVSEGETTINDYDGYELRFQRATDQMSAGQVPYWGRIVLLTSDADPSRGVSLIMLATSKAQGVTGLDDVGVKGDLPVILNSFRLDSSQ
jgi:hypothetical protein